MSERFQPPRVTLIVPDDPLRINPRTEVIHHIESPCGIDVSKLVSWHEWASGLQLGDERKGRYCRRCFPPGFQVMG